MREYKENKIFVTGVSGSGKTTFCKKYINNFNKLYISFEDNWGGYIKKIENQDGVFLEKLPNSFIVDAIPYNPNGYPQNFLDYCETNKNDVKIICIACTDKISFEKRLKEKFYNDVVQALIEYHGFYFGTMLELYSNLNVDYYDSYTDEFISSEEFYNRLKWITDGETNKINSELIKKYFLIYLETLKYDKKYQDIDCVDFKGYTSSYKTWENIKDLVDWKDKKIVDLGCFHGYFTFKVAKSGGIATGYDINPDVLRTTSYINIIEGDIIKTKRWCAGDEVPNEFDITLCLNVLHYFPDIDLGLQNIKTEYVLFEINNNLEENVIKYFDIIKRVSSHREGRTIILTKRK